jgi:hypothetical protein
MRSGSLRIFFFIIMEYYKDLDLADIVYFDEEGNQKTEQWKDVIGYEGLYQVSDLGRVKSFKKSQNKILKQSKSGDYLLVGIRKLNKSKTKTIIKTIYIHQLVAMAFLNHKPCGMKRVVDHIDENKTNNCLYNIRIISHRLNTSRSIKNVTSIYTGVHFNKKRNKWISQIRINGKIVCLGGFKYEIDAHLAYQEKLKTLKRK